MGAATSHRADTESAPCAWSGVTTPVDWSARVSDELGGAHVLVAARARTIRPLLLWSGVVAWLVPAVFLHGETGNVVSMPGGLLVLVLLLVGSDAVIAVSARGITVHRARRFTHRPYRHIPLAQAARLPQWLPLDLLRLRRHVWRVGTRRYALDSTPDAVALAAAVEQLRAR